MKIFLFSLLIYGSGIIALGFLAGHPIIGILLALFVVVSLYASLIYGQIIGAEFALRKPPAPGITWIKWNIGEDVFGIEKDHRGNDIAYTSEPFLFMPKEPITDDAPNVIEMPLIKIYQSKIIESVTGILSKQKRGRKKGSTDLKLDALDREALRMYAEDGIDFRTIFFMHLGKKYFLDADAWDKMSQDDKESAYPTFYKRVAIRKPQQNE